MSPILETIIIHLSALFLTGARGNEQAARQAAHQILNSYHPESENELRLAANIVSFGFHALEALAQSAAPDMPITRVLRLRGSAVNLGREAQKAEKRLEQLQKNRPEDQPAAQPEPAPKAEKAIEVVQDTRTVASYAKAHNVSFGRALELRERDKRIAASIARAEAKVAAINAAEAAAAAAQQAPAIA